MARLLAVTIAQLCAVGRVGSRDAAPMRRALGHTVRWGWFVVAALVILAALVLSIARLLAPLAADYAGVLEDMASRDIGRPITIGDIDLRMQGLQLQLRLRDINLYSENGKEVLQSLAAAYVVPDWAESLVHGTLRIRELIIQNARIAVIREADGSLSLRGVQFGSDEDWLESLSKLLQSQPNILMELRQSTVEWTDRASGAHTEFSGVDVSGQRDEEIYRLSVTAKLPPGVGTHLSVVAHVHGRLANPHGWSGRVYIKVDDLDLAAPAVRDLGIQRVASAGVVSLEAWGDWGEGRLQRLVGRLAGDGLDLASGPAGQGGIELSRLSTELEWSARDQGGLLRLAIPELRVANNRWPRTHVALSYSAQASGERVHRFAVDYLDLQDIWPQLRALSADWDSGWLSRLRSLSPSGQLRDVRIVTRSTEQGLSGYQASAGFDRLGVAAGGEFPGLSGLSGAMEADERGGQLTLGSRSVLFDAPGLFSRGLWIDQLSGTLLWGFDEAGLTLSSEYFSASTEDIVVNGQVRAVLGPARPYVDLHLFYRDGDGSHLGRYLPDRYMPPELTEWLETSIKTAHIRHGELRLRGDPLEFPFADASGLFKASLSIDKGTLKLSPTAPELTDIEARIEFVNQGLTMEVQQAHWLDVRVRPVTVEIHDLRRARLDVTGQALGDLGQMISIENHLGLPGTEPGISRYVRFEGPARLGLVLAIPLSGELHEPVRVDGSLSLDGAALAVRKADVRIERLKGRIHFDADTFTAEELEGIWRGTPVTLEGRTARDGSQLVSLQGRFPLSMFAPPGEDPLWRRLRGGALWRVQVTVPGSMKGQSRIGINAWSDLSGVAVDLPAPFGKSAAESRAFRFQGHWNDGLQGVLRIEYGSASVVALVTRRYGRSLVPRAELCLNQGKAILPKRGWRVRGAVNELSVDAWRAVYETASSVTGRKATWGDPGSLQDLDLWFSRLEVGGMALEDLSVKAKRGTSYWRVQLESPAIAGKVTVPLRLRSGVPLSGAFSRIKIETSKDGVATGAGIDPRSLPALSLSSTSLEYNQKRFRDVKLEATRQPDGVRIHLVQLAGDDFSAHAIGTWRVVPGGAQLTQLQGEMRTDDLGKTLKVYRLGDNVKDGRGTLKLDLSWPGAPYGFGFRGLRGRADLLIKKGRLSDVDSGAGRLIGLLNVGAVARRLSLDFSDVFKKGLYFDEVKGRFHLDGAQITTTNLEIKGPAAHIYVKGMTDVEKEQYDQLVTVVPEVGGGVAVAGTLVGGPLVGVTLLVADKILGRFGHGMGRLATFKYHVTGSWQDPVVAPLQIRKPATAIELEGEFE